MRHMDSIEDYFSDKPSGVIYGTELVGSGHIEYVAVHECIKCAALVKKDSRATHAADHEATLKLVHDLHSAAHHHLT